MLYEWPPSRQRGQMLIIMALALVALLGMTGIAVDLGFGFAHRREAQNAADAAALAGAQALGRHYINPSPATSGCGDSGTAECNNTTVLREITVAAISSLPNFPNPPSGNTTPTVPANTTITGYYVTTETQNPGTDISTTGGSSRPPAAVGVRAVVAYTYPTLFMRVFGAWASTMRVEAKARVLLRRSAQVGGPAPFIVCGGGPGGPSGNGAQEYTSTGYVIPSPSILVSGGGGTSVVNYANFTNHFFVVHSSNLGGVPGAGIPEADCGIATKRSGTPACQANPTDPSCSTNAFKGVATPSGAGTPTQCVPVNTIPCNMQGDTGTRAGPVYQAVAGFDGCTDSDEGNWNGCVVRLPIASDCDRNVLCTIETYAWFQICPGNLAGLAGRCNSDPNFPTPPSDCRTGSGCHVGRLLPAGMTNEPAGTGVIDPSAPGTFVLQLAPD